jgi:hypothetical protein
MKAVVTNVPMEHCERNPKTNGTGCSRNYDSYYVVLVLSRVQPSDWSKVLIDKQLETFSRSGKSQDQGNTSLPFPWLEGLLVLTFPKNIAQEARTQGSVEI